MTTSKKIFRFKLTETTIEYILAFSKKHQFDNRVDFKEAWKKFITDNEELINREKTRLKNLGYDGDIESKIYRSARYYFRKKDLTVKEAKKRRTYIACSESILKLIDEDININMRNNNSESEINFKPAIGYNKFIENYSKNYNDEIKRLETQNIDKDLIIDKIKKTYKNRCFVLSNKNT